ncbi:hypothetical protein J1N35_030538 [Gossypium stocksii]|uniref:Cytochrome P450 n=1 Tax=Gossypium stocksii TaxID=47602 RepID=A0A9D3UZW7_9ROSI|nr:hypothetical protein J1N35_030538 [Gossypium stocksii]
MILSHTQINSHHQLPNCHSPINDSIRMDHRVKSNLAMEASLFYFIVFFLFFYFLTRRLLQNKGLPPSPALSLPVIGHLHLIKRPLHRTLAKLSKQHGPILFVHFRSRPVLVVSSPSAAEECFTKNDIVFANRPRLLAGKHLGYNYTTLPWAPYGDHWRNLRRVAVLELLSSNRVQNYRGIRMDEIRSLILRLYRRSSKGGIVISWNRYFSWDRGVGSVTSAKQSKTLSKAREEIDMEIGQNRFMEEPDLGRLPYLHGIIKETFRMCPVSPVLVPHESSEECTVGGFSIPRGTMLLVNIWAIQNDPGLWEKASEFKPDRFVGPEAVNNGFALPFGTGRRRCPGESMAMGLIPLTLGSLIQCFEWERIGEEMVDMSEGSELTMPKAQPLVVKCRPRPAMINLLSQI